MFLQVHLKSLGPIDRKLHGHGENDGFVLCEYIILIMQKFSQIYKHQRCEKKDQRK